MLNVVTIVGVVQATEFSCVILHVVQQVCILVCCIVSREVECELLSCLVSLVVCIQNIQFCFCCNVLERNELGTIVHVGLYVSRISVDSDAVDAIVSPEPSIVTPHVTCGLTTPVEQLQEVDNVNLVTIGISVKHYVVVDVLQVDRTLPASNELVVCCFLNNTASICCSDTNICTHFLEDVSVVCLITNSVQDVLARLVVNQLDFTSFCVNSSNLSCLTVCNSIEVGVVECTSIDVESASLHSCSKC